MWLTLKNGMVSGAAFQVFSTCIGLLMYKKEFEFVKDTKLLADFV